MKKLLPLLLVGSSVFGQAPTNDMARNSGLPVPEVNFSEISYSASESDANLAVTIELDFVPLEAVTVELNLINAGTAVEGNDFTYTNQTVTIQTNESSKEVLIPIIDNNNVGNDTYFALELANPGFAVLGEDIKATAHILDDDRVLTYPVDAPVDFSFETNYLVDADGSAEIAAYNETDELLYVLNSEKSTVEILDFSDLTNISTVSTIDLSGFGTSGATSVAYYNGIVAAAVSNGPTANGVVVFMDAQGLNPSSVTVGNLPDNVSFTPDGTKVVTADEGQPNDDYSIDPEGTISVIDMTDGFGNITQDDVTTINFNSFDTQKAALILDGVRITGPNGTTVSQDVEPEYVTYSDDSQTAWVSLQENNALAVVDLVNLTITDILPLGTKDHSIDGNALDTSDKNDFIFMATWPIKGMYMPDAIAQYEVNGVPYIITANEGDSREYDTYVDEADFGDLDLDPTAFPNADVLQLNSTLGRLVVTNVNGDTDGDDDFDVIYSYGSRSFSIYNGNTGVQVYDSGDDFERYTAADPDYGQFFNASNSSSKLFKNRSDNKGPEPEGVTTAVIDGRTYAFITLERVGGFMAYDVTDPMNPEFIAYKNNRGDDGEDLGPEGIIYIAADDSPNGKGLIVMANEKSATISVYNVDVESLSTADFVSSDTDFFAYPNPTRGVAQVLFNKTVNAQVYDTTGRLIAAINNDNKFDVTGISNGTYYIKTDNNETQVLIIE